MNKFTLSLVALCFLSLASAPAADLTITTTSFFPGADAKKEIGIAGASLTIGQLIYLDSGTQTWKLADANLSAAAAQVSAIAGSAAAAGQPFVYIWKDDDMTVGATLSMTAPVYCLSATAGGIAPVADLTTGAYPAVVLVAKSTTKGIFNPTALRGPAAMSALFDLGNAPRIASLVLPSRRSVYDRPRGYDLSAFTRQRGFARAA